MENGWIGIVATIAVAVIAALPGIWASFRQRKLDRGTLSKMVTDSAKDFIEQYRKRVDELEEEIDTLKKESVEQRATIEGQRQEIDTHKESIRQQKILTISQQEQINMLTAKANAQERQIEEQQKQIEDQQKQINHLCQGAKMLQGQVIELGAVPVWVLPDKD